MTHSKKSVRSGSLDSISNRTWNKDEQAKNKRDQYLRKKKAEEKKLRKKLTDILKDQAVFDTYRDENGETIALDSGGTMGCYNDYNGHYENANYHYFGNNQLNYFAGNGFLGYVLCSLLYQDPTIERATSLIGDIAISPGFKLSPLNVPYRDSRNDPKMEMVRKFDKKFNLLNELMRASTMQKVFGVRYILFCVKNKGLTDEEKRKLYENEFEIDEIKKGTYKGFSQVDPYFVTPYLTAESLTEPASINYFRPKFYYINGIKYHHSWLTVIIENEVPNNLKSNYRYGGIPLVQKIWQAVYNAGRSAQEVPELLQTKREIIQKTVDFQNLVDDPAAQHAEEWNNERRSNSSIRYMPAEDDIIQLETTLQGVSDAVMDQYQLVAAIAKIPLSIFLSDTPKGFQATDSTDLKLFRLVCQKEQSLLDPILEKHYRCLSYSLFGEDLEICYYWNKIDAQTTKQQIESLNMLSQSLNLLTNGSIISPDEARMYLNKSELLEMDLDTDGDDFDDDIDDDEDEDGNSQFEDDNQTGGSY